MSAFTIEEKNLLVSLVNKYKDVIENKKTDANSNKEKTRKLDTEHKQNILKTGRGPPPPLPANDSLTEQIRNIIPTINFEIENPYDSNVLTENLNESSENCIIYIDYIESTPTEEKENTKRSKSTQPTQPTDSQLPIITDQRNKRKKESQEKEKRKADGVTHSRNKLIDLEARLRVKKMKDAIKQQSELHTKKLAVLEAER
ncbi:hypothetical protein ABEB36_000254 [Hypothenemus hampei]|uniref:Regulatory protein zeste n=1 Tax=Hypothenemus hampei TaxID=57062 RepID=A0ABD1FBE5_HYPHA